MRQNKLQISCDEMISKIDPLDDYCNAIRSVWSLEGVRNCDLHITLNKSYNTISQ